jgi:SAM-dependent methyltransferase
MSPSQDPGRLRLFPRLTDPNYLVLRSRRNIFEGWFRQLPGNRLRVLDVGAKYQPYRPLLGDRVERYVALDLGRQGKVTVVGDGQALPFAAESFDLVLISQVFEFFENPSLAAEQIFRVLRPGGVLIASLVAFAPLFTPEERWRFVPNGIRTILRPFHTIEVIPEVHDFGGFFRTTNVGLGTIFRFRGSRSLYRWTLCPLLNLLGLALERLRLPSSGQLTPNYSVRAVK